MTIRARMLVALLVGCACSLALVPAADAWIYWGHFAYGKGVGRAGLDGSESNESFIASPPGSYAFARGVAVDSNYLYWGTHGLNTTPHRSFEAPRIGRSLLDGSNVEYTFTASTGQNLSALSVSASHLYWTAENQDYSEVGRTPVIGGQQYQSFASVFGEPNPHACGVASDGTYVYFANRTTSSIGRATLADYATLQQKIEGQWIQLPDTGNETVYPCGVAVDDTYVYWGINSISRNGVISKGETIGRARKADASEVTNGFAGGGRSVTGLAIAGSSIYVSNWNDGQVGHGSIGRANLSGGGGDADFVTGLDAPWSVAADGLGPGAAPPIPQGGGVGNYVPPLIVGCNGCSFGGPPPGSNVPPDFSRVWGSHTTFAPASWSTPSYAVAVSASVSKGTVFNYILDKAGSVSIAITRPTSGRRVGKKCVATSPKNARKRKCSRSLTVATLTRLSHAGHNQVPFSGRIHSKALKPGSYKAVFVAKAATGTATKSKTFDFRIVRP